MKPHARRRACFATATLALFVSFAPAQAGGRTIVGEWAPDPRQCWPSQGAIAIGPLSVVGDDFRCDFTSVSRLGDVVTWRGACGFPDPARPAIVVASLRGDTLALRINGGENGPYRRCRGSRS